MPMAALVKRRRQLLVANEAVKRISRREHLLALPVVVHSREDPHAFEQPLERAGAEPRETPSEPLSSCIAGIAEL